MNYNAQYFIDRYSRIPESLWCSNAFINENEQRCALGHLGCGISYDVADYQDQVHSIDKLFKVIGANVEKVNDGKDPMFPQATPKQRILAALQTVQVATKKELVLSW